MIVTNNHSTLGLIMNEDAQETALVPSLTEKTLALVFSGKMELEVLLKEIETRADDLASEIDSTTADGRKELAKVATKINKSSQVIDDYGKGLVDKQKKALKVIDNQRKSARDYLETVRARVRKPILEYEAEAARLQAEALAREQYLSDWTAAIEEDEKFELKRQLAKARMEAEVNARVHAEVTKVVSTGNFGGVIKKEDPGMDRKREVNLQLMDFLKECGVSDGAARTVIVRIATGQTKLLTINY